MKWFQSSAASAAYKTGGIIRTAVKLLFASAVCFSLLAPACFMSSAAGPLLPGDRVTVSFYGSSLSGCAVKSISITPVSKTGRLELLSIKSNVNGAIIQSTDGGTYIAAFSSNTVLPDGSLIDCEYMATELGGDEISFSVRAKVTVNGVEQTVELPVQTPTAYRIGYGPDFDVNGDGAVNAIDLVRLMRVISGVSEEGNVDVNRDGYVDTKDLIRLVNALAADVGSDMSAF